MSVHPICGYEGRSGSRVRVVVAIHTRRSVVIGLFPLDPVVAEEHGQEGDEVPVDEARCEEGTDLESRTEGVCGGRAQKVWLR